MWYVAMPDRRRGPRGGHHTGSLPELSGLTPLDLVLYGAGNRHKSTCQWKWASAGLGPVAKFFRARSVRELRSAQSISAQLWIEIRPFRIQIHNRKLGHPVVSHGSYTGREKFATGPVAQTRRPLIGQIRQAVLAHFSGPAMAPSGLVGLGQQGPWSPAPRMIPAHAAHISCDGRRGFHADSPKNRRRRGSRSSIADTAATG